MNIKNNEIKIEKKSKLFFFLFFTCLAASFFSVFYRMIILKDYEVFYSELDIPAGLTIFKQ